MKNKFCFTSKVFFVLKIFKFLSRLFGRVAKRLDMKDKLISTLITSQPGQQTIVIRILLSTTRCKSNQTMKFVLFNDYDMRNICLEKSYTKFGGETSRRLFPKKLKLSISLDQLFKVFYRLFFIVCQAEGYQNILKLSCRPLPLTSIKAFFNKPCLSFCIILEENYIFSYILLIDQTSLPGCLSLVRYYAICVF